EVGQSRFSGRVVLLADVEQNEDGGRPGGGDGPQDDLKAVFQAEGLRAVCGVDSGGGPQETDDSERAERTGGPREPREPALDVRRVVLVRRRRSGVRLLFAGSAVNSFHGTRRAVADGDQRYECR